MATMIERSAKVYPYVYISFTFGRDGGDLLSCLAAGRRDLSSISKM